RPGARSRWAITTSSPHKPDHTTKPARQSSLFLQIMFFLKWIIPTPIRDTVDSWIAYSTGLFSFMFRSVTFKPLTQNDKMGQASIDTNCTATRNRKNELRRSFYRRIQKTKTTD
ncbi:hypothetical protein PENTCL1PPCAC_4845, partial [Pristionchus entomophagus]